MTHSIIYIYILFIPKKHQSVQFQGQLHHLFAPFKVRGPDAAGSKNFFAVSGRQGERLQLRLEVWKMNDQWIGLGEILQENPIFNGKKHGFL